MKKKLYIAFVFLFLIICLEFLSKFYFSELNISQTGPLEIQFGSRDAKKSFFSRYVEIKIREDGIKKKLHDLDLNKILIIGDSISAGYGISLRDIYYKQTELFLKEEKEKILFINIATFGKKANLDSYLKILQTNNNLVKSGDLVLYQFNYNDILDNIDSNVNLKTNRELSENQSFWNRVSISTANFRYKILNKSSFLRVLQHYAGISLKKKNGNCIERKLDALGIYTHVYAAKGFENESTKYWEIFEAKLLNLINFVKKKDVRFVILIIPPSIEVPHQNYSNIYNYDISCKTLDPAEKIKEFGNKYNFKIIDTTPLFIEQAKEIFESEKIINSLFIKYSFKSSKCIWSHIDCFKIKRLYKEIEIQLKNLEILIEL